MHYKTYEEVPYESDAESDDVCSSGLKNHRWVGLSWLAVALPHTLRADLLCIPKIKMVCVLQLHQHTLFGVLCTLSFLQCIRSPLELWDIYILQDMYV